MQTNRALTVLFLLLQKEVYIELTTTSSVIIN